MEKFGHALLGLRAVDTEDAGNRIEQGLLRIKGITFASVHPAAQQVRVEFDRSQLTLALIEATLQKMRYGVTSETTGATPAREVAGPDVKEASWYSRNQELVWSLLAGALLLVGWVGETWLGLPLPWRSACSLRRMLLAVTTCHDTRLVPSGRGCSASI